MNFGNAIFYLKKGERMTRKGWNGKGMYIELQVPDKNSKMKRPYIYMCPVDGQLVPWVASQTDMLAEDWQTVKQFIFIRSWKTKKNLSKIAIAQDAIVGA